MQVFDIHLRVYEVIHEDIVCGYVVVALQITLLESYEIKEECILIHDNTKSLFFNLIAFEECHLEFDHYIATYNIFMDNLINSEVDTIHFHNKKIINDKLGSDKEATNLFNWLFKEVVFDIGDCYL